MAKARAAAKGSDRAFTARQRAIVGAIQWAGSKAGLAHKLGVTERTVENWIARNRIPRAKAALLELVTGGKVRAASVREERS